VSEERYTSQVFRLRAEMMDRLRAAQWPAHENMPAPTIGNPFTSPDGAMPFEWMYLERVSSGSTVDKFGPVGRQEDITATLVLNTAMPGFDEDQAVERAGLLSAVVESIIFDYQMNTPTAFNLDGEWLSAEVTGVELTPYPAREGYGAMVEIQFSVSADI
jgi:hypothetical protein